MDAFPLPAGAPLARRADAEPFAATDLRSVLSSIGETLYTWDIATDRLIWAGNAQVTLRAEPAEAMATGRAYARLIQPGSGESRYDAVMRSVERDCGHGVPFQTQYAFRSPGGETFWLQDTGRWFAGRDGSPARVHGVVRIVPEPAQGAAGGASGGDVDPLTNAMTRRQLTEVLTDEIMRARKQHRSFALALVGIEHISEFNEAYGFEVADEVIAAVAQRLRAVTRRGDLLARYAGNKLAVVFLRCSQEQLPIAAARLIDAIRTEPVPTSVGPIHAAVRVGGVLLPRYGSNAVQAMQNAEEALGDAKSPHSRNYHFYSPDRRRDERRFSNRRVTDAVTSALNDRRVSIARQPIVASGTRRVAFEEVLVRVSREDGSHMPAGQIVPHIEKLGIVPLLDHRVLELTTATLMREPDAVLSMNVSSATLQRAEWIEALAAHLAGDPKLAPRLIVELTETCFIEDTEAIQRGIAAMRDNGVRVAIDDFGAGHTSFRHLRDLGVDIVKIDGAFVQNLRRSTDDRFFVRTLVDLARHLQLEIVAEWVQDEETARQLESWGVHYLQGQLFGSATMAQTFPTMILAQPARG